MNPTAADVERQRRILDLVEAALEWPRAERSRRLDQVPDADAAFIAEVEHLIQLATDAGRSLPTALPVNAAVGIEPPPPERLGRWRLGEMLGRGGMGRVYRASRDDGVFEQEVAIKLLREGLATDAMRTQFERERQILANLQHPNIARLLDGGVTDDGQSYIVMELLHARSILRFAEDHRIDARGTVRLFVPVCEAVAHAHAHLVVHADIKPNNVVVTDDRQIRLLDFGVARVLAAAQDAADSGIRAGAGPIGLTAAYASPSRRQGGAAGIADDIYSLGVLLEDLLRRLPEPAPDLVAIAVRAREEDPAHRYATVEAMREDLLAWLDDRPVRAMGNDWRYLVRKWLRRYRLASAIAAGSIVLLTAAAVSLAVLYVRADESRRAAEARFADLRELSSFLLFDVYDRLERLPRALSLQRDLAQRAQRYLDTLAEDHNAPTDVRLEAIEGLRRLTRIQAAPGEASLGEFAQARANLLRAERLAAALPDGPGTAGERALLTARLALLEATIALNQSNDFDATDAALERARLALAVAAREKPGDPQVRILERDYAVELAGALQWRGEYGQAQDVARGELARTGPVPVTDRAATLQRARLLDVLAESLFYGGHVAAAEMPYREHFQMLEALVHANPGDVSLERRAARAGWALGTTLLELGRAVEAERLLAAMQPRYAQLHLFEPDDRELTRSQEIAASAWAQSLAALGRHEQAQPILRHSVDFRLRELANDPDNLSLMRDLAIARATLGGSLAASGDMKAACPTFAQAERDFARIGQSGKLAGLDRDFSLRVLREQHARYCSPSSPSR